MKRTKDPSQYNHYQPHEYVNSSHPRNTMYMNTLETMKNVMIKTKQRKIVPVGAMKLYRPYFFKKSTIHKISILQEKREGCPFFTHDKCLEK